MNPYLRRLRKLELLGAGADETPREFICRPPSETREEWIARRQAGMGWVNVEGAGWTQLSTYSPPSPH